MIIDFRFRNFKSFKEEQYFSLKALAGKNKSDNTFDVLLSNGKSIKLLRSAVIYGANASGKSNFIEAFKIFHQLLIASNENKNGERIENYNPFLFDESSITNKCSFQLEWISKDKVIHKYSFGFDNHRFFKESLENYPNGRPSNLFERKLGKDKLLDTVELGKSLNDKRIDKRVLPNQLYLSKIGGKEGHDQLGKIYRQFLNIGVWSGTDFLAKERLKSVVIQSMKPKENKKFVQRLEKLLKIADTGVAGIDLKSAKREELVFPEFISEVEKEKAIKRYSDRPFTKHPYFNDKQQQGKMFELPLEHNSTGTQTLFTLGGLLLIALQQGGVILYDEFDNSLHPKLCRFLIRLFHNPLTNPKNAQLVFATHEVSLLDKAIFRKDQIWFAEKDKYGQSTLFSAQDFEGVRDDTPFDKWYMAGKFGGYPKIKELNFIFDNE